MKQEETFKIVEPLTVYLRYKGWLVEKTHGNRFQCGFPDLWTCHHIYMYRWIECKIIRDGDIRFEQTQIAKFNNWIGHGVKIWVICGTDMRGPSGKMELEREYNKLFKEPNCAYMLNPQIRRMMLRG